MIHFRKLRLTFSPQWVTSSFPETHIKQSQNPLRVTGFLFLIAQNPRFYRTKGAVQSVTGKARKEAQSALLEYLHSTRSLQFLDADNMCKNSPFFLDELLKKVKNGGELKRSVSRYLCYHPINEFEPFFESMGLKPQEYAPILPRNMIFLNDDQLLMENYHTLCNYGVPRNNMGKIFKEAPEVFRYDRGVLLSKIQAYEKLGVAPSTLVKFIAYSPCLLIGDVNLDAVRVFGKLKHLVKDDNWIEGHLLDGDCSNWSQMLELLWLLCKVYSEEQLAKVICQHPRVIFEDSGGRTLSLIVFLLKFGFSLNQISLLFLDFPQIQIGNFVSNLRQCFLFLSEIEMQPAEIGKIFRSHSLLLGSSTLKKTSSLLCNLKAGKKQLCRLVQDNPQVMKNWVMGRRIEPLVNSKEEEDCKLQKTEFLLGLGYVKNSKKMKEAFKQFRGKGTELQERFDCIIKAGFDFGDVLEMIKLCPQILNQTTDRINMKIDYLVQEGYPLSSLVNFPSFLSYTPRRVKLRLSMYNWLKDQGAAEPGLALSTIIACSDKMFLQQYVNRHPTGLQVWQDLRKEICSEN